MIKLRHLLFIILYVSSSLGFLLAQESAFEVVLTDYDMDFPMTFCCETADGHFLVVPEKDCKVLKISQEGEVVGEMEYKMELENNEVALISGLVDVPGDPSHHVIIVEPHDNNTGVGNTFHIVRFNDNLEYDSSEVIAVDLSEYVSIFTIVLPPRYFIDADGSLCFASLAVKLDGTTSLMYVRVSPEAEVNAVFDNRIGFDDPELEICHFFPRGDFYDMVVKFKNGLSNYVCLYQVSHEFVSDSICCFIDNLSNDPLLQYDNHYDTLFTAGTFVNDYYIPLWISENLLLPTRVWSWSGSTSYGVGIWMLDSDYNLINQVFFDVKNGTGFHNMELLRAWTPLVHNSNNIYLCYNPYKGPYQPMQTVICKLDTDLNLEWKRWYGGNNEWHQINGFITTSDGGCLLSGTGNPNPSQMDYHTYPYIFKITSEGYCPVVENGNSLLKPYTFFPNPVGDVLQMEYSPDVTPVLLELLDLQGRLVLSQQNNLETLNMDGLPAGTYTLRLTLNKGKAFSEKVVKL